MELVYIDNARHAYLKVTHQQLVANIDPMRISSYSGMDNTHAYLEEDLDAVLFINACAENGINVTYTEEYNESFSTTHNYNPNRLVRKIKHES